MSQLRPAIFLLLLLTVVCGVVYPLLTTGLAQWLFPWQANGSLLKVEGEERGFALIGQAFSQPGEFWGRPSATGDKPYNPLASSGSNLAASNPALDKAVAERVAALRAANPQANGPVPVDLVTSSASGLDPEISPQAALWQAPRVAAARQLPLAKVDALVDSLTQRPLLPFIGEPTVNVLQLNLALNDLK